jgi:hypothetical protein
MEHNDWQGKPKYMEENLPQCHYVYHISYMGCSRIEPGPTARNQHLTTSNMPCPKRQLHLMIVMTG